MTGGPSRWCGNQHSKNRPWYLPRDVNLHGFDIWRMHPRLYWRCGTQIKWEKESWDQKIYFSLWFHELDQTWVPEFDGSERRVIQDSVDMNEDLIDNKDRWNEENYKCFVHVTCEWKLIWFVSWLELIWNEHMEIGFTYLFDICKCPGCEPITCLGEGQKRHFIKHESANLFSRLVSTCWRVGMPCMTFSICQIFQPRRLPSASVAQIGASSICLNLIKAGACKRPSWLNIEVYFSLTGISLMANKRPRKLFGGV